MWKLWYIFSCITVQLIHGKLFGDHICLEEKSYTVNVTEHFLRNATVRNYKWCMNVPPRCSYYTTKTVNDTKIVEKIYTDTVEKCCPGFYENDNKCLPPCQNCENGICDGEICVCSPGFSGENCDSSCPAGFWGLNCTNKCICDYKSCNPVNGSCNSENESTNNTTVKTNLDADMITDEEFSTTESSYNSLTTADSIFKSDQELIGNYNSSPSSTRDETRKNDIESEYNSVLDIPSKNGTSIVPAFSDLENRNKLKQLENPTTTAILLKDTQHKKDDNYLLNENKELLIPVGIKYEQIGEKEVPATTSSNTFKEKHYLVLEDSTNNNRASLAKDNNLINSVSISAATTTAIILLAILLLSIHQIRRSKRKAKEKLDSKKTVGVSTVSVYTTSIFHTPLPDPPTFENPSYLTPMEYQNCSNEVKAFETHVVSNMDMQNRNNCYKDYMYDHPPSTGSYRAASIIEPLDIDTTHHASTVTQSEPVYDEIPCRDGYDQVNEATSYYSQPKSLYMNTCSRAKS